MGMGAAQRATVLLAALLAVGVGLAAAGKGDPLPEEIERVHVLFMNHLDVGFSGGTNYPHLLGYAREVIDLYLNTYYPNAINVSRTLREQGSGDAFTYTTKGWLVSLMLDCPQGMGFPCPDAAAVADFKQAIADGDIAWHAFPFNTQMEFLDRPMVEFALQLVRDLDATLDTPRKLVFSQRDVPGTTLAGLPILAKAGVKAMSFGVNGASAPPDVPTEFIWRATDENNETHSMFVMYHDGGYGGITPESCAMLPGFYEALAIYFKNDNDGPPSAAEVTAAYAALRLSFPNAHVFASTFERFYEAVEASGALANLPVVTDMEIGDTWIHGVANDPLRGLLFREILRGRSACLADGVCSLEDPAFYNFSRLLLKGAEHTGGGDVKRFLEAEGHNPAESYYRWTNADFGAHRDDERYRALELSWDEQRDWSLRFALEALGEDHPLMTRYLNDLLPAARPPSNEPDLSDYEVLPLDQVIEFGSWRLGFDAAGAISLLEERETGRSAASAAHPLAAFQYQSLSGEDYDFFMRSYLNCPYPDCPEWALLDFGKLKLQEIAAPESQRVRPTASALYTRTMSDGRLHAVAVSSLPAELVSSYGAPRTVHTEVYLPARGNANEAAVHIHVTLYNKTTTRLPEALWVTFSPRDSALRRDVWRMSKLAVELSPLNVVNNGSRHMHNVEYVTAPHVRVQPLDSGLACFGEPNALPIPLEEEPDLAFGVSFNIYNNQWGTNYVMWYPYRNDELNLRSRFVLWLTD